jgi:hypothetical protein
MELTKKYFIHLLKIAWLRQNYPIGTSEGSNKYVEALYIPLIDIQCELINMGMYPSWGAARLFQVPDFVLHAPVVNVDLSADLNTFLSLKEVNSGSRIATILPNISLEPDSPLGQKFPEMAKFLSDFRAKYGMDVFYAFPPSKDSVGPVYRGREYFSPDNDIHGDELFKIFEEVVRFSAEYPDKDTMLAAFMEMIEARPDKDLYLLVATEIGLIPMQPPKAPEPEKEEEKENA